MIKENEAETPVKTIAEETDGNRKSRQIKNGVSDFIYVCIMSVLSVINCSVSTHLCSVRHSSGHRAQGSLHSAEDVIYCSNTVNDFYNIFLLLVVYNWLGFILLDFKPFPQF